MKRLALLFVLIAVSSNAQKTIRSIKLDSAVFQCINQVRIENNQPSVLKFFYGKVREFSYTVTDKNCDANYFEHSAMDSTRKYCNAECIYQHKLIFGDATKYDVDSHPDQIRALAKHAVDAWMNSPSHRNAILMSWNRSFTITSQIEISQNGKSAIVSISYHAVQYTNKLLEIPYGLRNDASYYMK
jgi:uncharacterized protein YkwD